jgi:hypothetical protein
MEFLQWLDSAWRIVFAGLFALLPGTVFWLAVLGMMALARKLGRSPFYRVFRGKMRPA